MGQVIINMFRPQREGSIVSDLNLSLKTAITQLFNIIFEIKRDSENKRERERERDKENEREKI